MTYSLSPPIHPAVPVHLHPGLARSPFAAGREALALLYALYAAILDDECGEEEFRAVVADVDRCLDELRRHRVTCGGPALAATIQRVENGKRLVEERWKGEQWDTR